MIPLCIPNLCGNEEAYLVECVKTTFVSSVGKFVNKFEEELAAIFSSPCNAIAVSSGTVALQLSLSGVGVNHGDLVITQALTFVATASAICAVGAEPAFIDVDKSDMTMSPKALENFLGTECDRNAREVIHRESGRRIAAILPVCTLGIPVDVLALNEIAERYNLPMVIDAAAAIGSARSDLDFGNLPNTLITVSFNGNKIVTCGGGGAIVGGDKALMKRIKHLSTTARVGDEYDHDVRGFNYRMTNLQAAVGCAQLENLELFLSKKKYINDFYSARFEDLTKIQPLNIPSDIVPSYWFPAFVAQSPITADVRQAYRDQAIDVRPFWKPMTLQKPYENCPKGPMDVTDAIWEHLLVLPCSTNISDDDLDKVATTTRDIFQND